ncbi:MAG: histidinol-phosphate transaminase [Gammaproteobacteria bacterium]
MHDKNSIYGLATDGVRHLVPYKPGKPMEELERELGLSKIVKLASNENPLGPSPRAIEAIQSFMKDLARYPDGNGFNLKAALASKLMVNANQITLGNGSNEILELVARAFLTRDSEVVFSRHAFAVYPIVTQAVGAKAVVASAAPDFGHDLAEMRRCVGEKTRLIFIANPNNPTGGYLSEAELGAFLESLPADIICVLDEAYFEYVDKPDYPDSIPWLQNHPNLIVTRTFSKAYGLAGFRCGYGISSPEMTDILNRVRQPFNNNSLALTAAEAALSDTGFLGRTLEINSEGMVQLTRFFDEYDLKWLPSVGNFITVDMNRDAAPIYDALLREGVIVRPIANYEMPNHLRISIGTRDENKFFMDALTHVLRNV